MLGGLGRVRHPGYGKGVRRGLGRRASRPGPVGLEGPESRGSGPPGKRAAGEGLRNRPPVWRRSGSAGARQGGREWAS